MAGGAGRSAKRHGESGRAIEGDAGSRVDPRTIEAVFHCDLCGAVMLNLHCKLVCERCGYKRDCSDP